MANYWDVLYDAFDIASGPTWKSKVVGAYMPPGGADTPNDATGNANDGAWTGTEQYTDTLYGRGFLLNGSSHINCGVLLPSTPGNRTVLCRATANHANEVRQYAWGQSPPANNTGQAFRLRPRNPVTSQGTLNAARVEFNSGYQVGSIANGSETHAYAVVSPASATQGSDVLVYQDGTLITKSSQVSPTLTGTANNFLIGNDVGNDDEHLNGTVAELFVISGEITAQEAADHAAGPTPTPLTAPVIDEDGIVTSATYDAHDNGAVTETFQWQRLDGTWQDVAGQTSAANGPADFGGVAGDYRLVAYPSNNAGASTVMATPSNVVTYAGGGTPTLTANVATIEVEPQSATLTVNRLLTAQPGTIEVVPQAATLTIHRQLTALPAVIEIEPQSANLTTAPEITATPAVIEVVPQAATLTIHRRITALPAVIEVAPQAAAISEPTADIVLTAQPATVEVVPQAATLTIHRRIVALPAVIEVKPITATIGEQPAVNITGVNLVKVPVQTNFVKVPVRTNYVKVPVS